VTGGKGNGPELERKPVAGASETGAALCPACGRPMKPWALICFRCFCALPMGTRYSLAAALPKRPGALNSAILILRQMEKDKRAFQTGDLFREGENGSQGL
jgi:hypothetical protein